MLRTSSQRAHISAQGKPVALETVIDVRSLLCLQKYMSVYRELANPQQNPRKTSYSWAMVLYSYILREAPASFCLVWPGHTAGWHGRTLSPAPCCQLCVHTKETPASPLDYYGADVQALYFQLHDVVSYIKELNTSTLMRLKKL